jgi:hypothetical protein
VIRPPHHARHRGDGLLCGRKELWITQLDAAAAAVDELELLSDFDDEVDPLSDFVESDFFSDDELDDSELLDDEPFDELLDASRLSVR